VFTIINVQGATRSQGSLASHRYFPLPTRQKILQMVKLLDSKHAKRICILMLNEIYLRFRYICKNISTYASICNSIFIEVFNC